MGRGVQRSRRRAALLVTKLLGDPAGTVRGKAALRSYFAKGLAAAPDLKFELLDVFTGVSSVAVYFRSSVRRLQLEVMELDSDGRITRECSSITGTLSTY